jgi:hypothetical protein
MFVQRYLARWFLCGLRRAYKGGGVGWHAWDVHVKCGGVGGIANATLHSQNSGVCLLSLWVLQRHLHIVTVVSGGSSGENSDAG